MVYRAEGTYAYLVNAPRYARHVLSSNERNYANPHHPYRDLAPHYRPGGLFLFGIGTTRSDRGAADDVARELTATARRAALDVTKDGPATVPVERVMRRVTFEVAVRSTFGVDAAEWAPGFVDASSFLEECWVNDPVPAAASEAELEAQAIQQRAAQSIARAAAITGRDRPVPDGLVVAIVRTLLNSYNATAMGLTWALYEIARRPDVQARARHEVEETLADRPAGAADVRGLPYLRRVALETLRLYPPAWNIGRRSIAPDRLGDTVVHPGCPVLVSPYALHRLPALWPDAGEFLPDRHRDERKPPYAYLPFGAGKRRCPAAGVAVGHLQLLLATWLQHCEIAPADPEPVGRRGLVALRPDPPLRLRFTPRGRRPGTSCRLSNSGVTAEAD